MKVKFKVWDKTNEKLLRGRSIVCKAGTSDVLFVWADKFNLDESNTQVFACDEYMKNNKSTPHKDIDMRLLSECEIVGSIITSDEVGHKQ